MSTHVISSAAVQFGPESRYHLLLAHTPAVQASQKSRKNDFGEDLRRGAHGECSSEYFANNDGKSWQQLECENDIPTRTSTGEEHGYNNCSALVTKRKYLLKPPSYTGANKQTLLSREPRTHQCHLTFMPSLPVSASPASV